MSIEPHFVNCIDWRRVLDFKAAISTQLNKPSERFIKSKFVDSAIARASNGFYSYVDQIGYDLIGTDGGRIEIKSKKNLKNSKSKAKVSCRLHNAMSETFIEDYSTTDAFDWLLIVGENSVGYISSEDCGNNLKYTQDCVITDFTHKEIKWIVEDHNCSSSSDFVDVEQLLFSLLNGVLDNFF